MSLTGVSSISLTSNRVCLCRLSVCLFVSTTMEQRYSIIYEVGAPLPTFVRSYAKNIII